MTFRELEARWLWHNVAAPHNVKTCTVCLEYEVARQNPLTNVS